MTGRIIVVTGSASGIGAASARLLRDRGHQVIGVDLHDAEICADLGTAEGRAAAIEGILTLANGAIDGLVNCAGVSSAIQDERRVLAINYFGSAALLQGLRAALARTATPAAVVVSSYAMVLPTPLPTAIDACLAMDVPAALDLVGQDPRVGSIWPAYATSKSALSHLVRRLAPSADWSGQGIALNAVVPAVTRTPMIARHLATAQGTEALLAAAPSPMGRIAEPEDVAELICFLVSGLARQIAGQVIFVDGGLDALRRPLAALQPALD